MFLIIMMTWCTELLKSRLIMLALVYLIEQQISFNNLSKPIRYQVYQMRLMILFGCMKKEWKKNLGQGYRTYRKKVWKNYCSNEFI